MANWDYFTALHFKNSNKKQLSCCHNRQGCPQEYQVLKLGTAEAYGGVSRMGRAAREPLRLLQRCMRKGSRAPRRHTGLSHSRGKYLFSSYPPTRLSHPPTAAIPNPALMLAQCRIEPWSCAVEHLSICSSVSQRRSPDRPREMPLPTEPAGTCALSQLRPSPSCEQPREPPLLSV